MKSLNWVASPETFIILTLFVAIYVWHHHHPRQGWKVLVLMAGNVLTIILKELFDRPRPSIDQVRVLIHETGFSFPSGHALGVVIFAAAMMVLWRPGHHRRHGLLATLLVGLIILVGWSRLYLGVHWLTDILAGYLLATGWVWLCVRYWWPGIDRHVPTG